MEGLGAVYIGIRGTILALDSATGTEIWRTTDKRPPSGPLQDLDPSLGVDQL